jgi:hypothetical protein
MARRNEIVEDFTPAFTMAGGSLGASILGGSLDSALPVGTTNPLTTTGSTLGRFTGPVATIGVLGITTKQFKKIENKL